MRKGMVYVYLNVMHVLIVIVINGFFNNIFWMYTYVLLNIEPMKEHNVYNKLCHTKEVEELYPLFGEWDIIFRLTVENLEHAGKIIINKIRSIDGILATKTLLGY